MTRCARLFHLILKEGEDVCGLPQSQVGLIRKYIPFAQKLARENNIDVDIFFQNVSASSVKTPLSFKKNSDARKNAEKHIIETLLINRSPTTASIHEALGIEYFSKPMRSPKKKIVSIPFSLTSSTHNESAARNRVFLSILSSGQIKKLSDYASKNDLSNEYEALCKIISSLDG
jgi:hypothetical protein